MALDPASLFASAFQPRMAPVAPVAAPVAAPVTQVAPLPPVAATDVPMTATTADPAAAQAGLVAPEGLLRMLARMQALHPDRFGKFMDKPFMNQFGITPEQIAAVPNFGFRSMDIYNRRMSHGGRGDEMPGMPAPAQGIAVGEPSPAAVSGLAAPNAGQNFMTTQGWPAADWQGHMDTIRANAQQRLQAAGGGLNSGWGGGFGTRTWG